MAEYLDEIIADAQSRFQHSKPQKRPQLVRAWISNNVRGATARAAMLRLDAIS
ncbi:hypothetical protein [Pseudoponticoccus marisrubri]|uniref:hypothetical protein n=1 Tax=Pseudoponticoccus marisrubri TaxID=1685382 RepID=UPI0012FD9083|nr:hypothetical protein [Pseudoponticoccus marisrubri]